MSPWLGDVGPPGNFAGYSAISKLVLSADMLIGRPEIFPVLLFSDYIQKGKIMKIRILNVFNDKYTILKNLFGYDTFRPGQERMIDDILSGRDCFAVMPTGAGKSCCYQIPALMLQGITLVVSPLISLMKDQVTALKQLGVAAAYLNSSLTQRQFDLALSNARYGLYKIIYVAPERLLTQGFLDFASSVEISLLAVMKRTAYPMGTGFSSLILIPISPFKTPTVAAFTATATEQVRDVVKYPVLQSGCHGNHFIGIIILRSSSAENKYSALLDYIRAHKSDRGIVYCSTRKTVDDPSNLRSPEFQSADTTPVWTTKSGANQKDFTYDRIDG